MYTRVINVYPDFKIVGGAEKIIFTLHKNLLGGNNNIIMGMSALSNHNFHEFKSEEFKLLSFNNVKIHKNDIFISHHRKTTFYLILISRFFNFNLKVIHVAHNEFSTLKYFTLFPNKIIAVSEKVKNNLINFFNQDLNKIKVIYNGLNDDLLSYEDKVFDNSSIKILYPARINRVKQQVDIVKALEGKLNKSIKIDFAGIGEDFEKLDFLCKKSDQFNCLGFINIHQVISNYDFVMLFSKNEGLPLSLIESCMFRVPILANNVGGNLEILENGNNGIVLSDLGTLAAELNNLMYISQQEYSRLSFQARFTYESKFRKIDMLNSYLELINSF